MGILGTHCCEWISCSGHCGPWNLRCINQQFMSQQWTLKLGMPRHGIWACPGMVFLVFFTLSYRRTLKLKWVKLLAFGCNGSHRWVFENRPTVLLTMWQWGVLYQEGDQFTRLFEWKDGPLVLSMKEGAMFLCDEISLADDSVLERLNSVLEPARTLVCNAKYWTRAL